MASRVTNIIVTVHRYLYRVTNGRIGARLAGIPILLLNTTGRKSGKQYTIPLAYHPAQEGYVVVASNNALPKNPGWYYNVLADNNITIQVGQDIFAVSARELQGNQREMMWQQATKTNSAWDGYKEKTERQIPVILLRPQ